MVSQITRQEKKVIAMVTILTPRKMSFENSTFFLVCRGITYVGCRIYPGRRKPTPQAVKKMKARMRYIAKEYEAGLIDFDAVDATMQSYFGMLGHCASHGLQKWIEKYIIFKRRDSELSQEVNTWT